MDVKLAVLFTREIKPLPVKVNIGHAFQLCNGAIRKPPHFGIHIRQSGQHSRYRAAAVRSVVHMWCAIFFLKQCFMKSTCLNGQQPIIICVYGLHLLLSVFWKCIEQLLSQQLETGQEF